MLTLYEDDAELVLMALQRIESKAARLIERIEQYLKDAVEEQADMPELRSSNLQSADYSAETQSLTVAFKGGSTYTYADVPEAVYTGLMAAPSPGKYFASTIKDRFTFTRG